jgi:hypothetical protein
MIPVFVWTIFTRLERNKRINVHVDAANSHARDANPSKDNFFRSMTHNEGMIFTGTPAASRWPRRGPSPFKTTTALKRVRSMIEVSRSSDRPVP